MKDVFRILVTILASAIFVAGLIFAATYSSRPSADRQESNQEAAPAESESISVKRALTYKVLCDLGNGYYLVDISEGGAFGSGFMRLHRDELSKFRRRGR